MIQKIADTIKDPKILTALVAGLIAPKIISAIAAKAGKLMKAKS